MKHEIPPYHYELPDGTISAGFDDIYAAHYAGCRATWHTDMNRNLVKVFNSEGAHVPTWSYCDDCNYAQHICGGCGEYLNHEQGGACEDCARELRKDVEAGLLKPSSPSSAENRTAMDEKYSWTASDATQGESK